MILNRCPAAFALYRLCEKMGHQVVIITDTVIEAACRIDSFADRLRQEFRELKNGGSLYPEVPQGW